MVITDQDIELMFRDARRVREIADEMSSMSNGSLLKAHNSIDAVWSGVAATRFLQRCEETRSLITNTASALRRFADEIENRARMLETAMKMDSNIAGKIGAKTAKSGQP